MTRPVSSRLVVCVALLLGLTLDVAPRGWGHPAAHSPATGSERWYVPLVSRPARVYLPCVTKSYPRRMALSLDLPYFTGANTANFGFYEEYGYSIETAMRTAREAGVTVLRIYFWLGEKPWGWRPQEEYDRALALAADYGIRVILVINDCCPSSGETDEVYWQTRPYCDFTSEQKLIKMKEHITSVFSRRNTVNGRIYKDDPTILAWDIANEPRLDFFTDAQITWWMTEVTDHIKSLDPDTLVTMGPAISGPPYSESPQHYERFNVPGLDFFSVHYYPLGVCLTHYEPDTVSARLAEMVQLIEGFAGLGKPVILGEFALGTMRSLEGEWGSNPDKRLVQAWVLDHKLIMDTAYEAGACGVVLWGWGDPATKDVPLWWQDEDHDITEVELCEMLRDYVPPPGTYPQ